MPKQAALKRSASSKPKKRKAPKHRSFRLSQRISVKSVMGPWQITKQTLRTVKNNKKLFGGIVVLLTISNLLIVQAYGSFTNLTEIKEGIEAILGDQSSRIGVSWALFGSLVSSGMGQSSETAGIYQSILVTIFSLAIIWALRQVLAQEKIAFKDIFYKGMYPLIPFILVLFVIGLQLLPAVVGSFIYTTIFTDGLAVTALEQVLWVLFCLLLYVFSAYMILSSIFAVYIVTLPDMTPMKALRSARSIVFGRRFKIAVRIVYLATILCLLSLAILMPVIFLATGAAQYVVYLLLAIILVFSHSYMYILYRELL